MNKKYEFDSDQVGIIKISTKKAAVATNTEPAGAVTTKLRPKFSKNNQEYGVKPRYVLLTREIAVTAPSMFTVVKTATLPILTKAVFASAAFDVGVKVTIDMIEWTVADKFPESY